MGIFSAVGSIVGGIAGLDDQAPDVFDFFQPRRVFSRGFRTPGGSFQVKKGGRLRFKRTRRGKRFQRQLEADKTDLSGVAQGFRDSLGFLRRTARPAIGRLFAESASERAGLRALREEVRPGFGRLTDAVVTAQRAARDKTLGDIRESFAQRNILGSSFATREAAGVAADFAREEERARSQALIQEIELRRAITEDIQGFLRLDQETLQAQFGLSQEEARLLQGETQAIVERANITRTQLDQDLKELNLAAAVKSDLLNLTAQMALAQAGLEAQAAADRGSAISGIFGGLDELFGT